MRSDDAKRKERDNRAEREQAERDRAWNEAYSRALAGDPSALQLIDPAAAGVFIRALQRKAEKKATQQREDQEAAERLQELIRRALAGDLEALAILSLSFPRIYEAIAAVLHHREKERLLMLRSDPRVDVVKGHAKGIGVGEIPANVEIARALLMAVHIQAQGTVDIAQAQKLIDRLYKDLHVDTLKANGDVHLVRDLISKEDYAIATGMHLGKTGYQIDFLSPIEHPRPDHQSRDVSAGLALIRETIARHDAQSLWVEVDDSMHKHYENAGFKVIAQPHPTDPSQLMMLHLPLTKDSKRRFERDTFKLWREHVQAWYQANWDPLHGVHALPAREAIARMNEAADRGERLWIQKRPT